MHNGVCIKYYGWCINRVTQYAVWMSLYIPALHPRTVHLHKKSTFYSSKEGLKTQFSKFYVAGYSVSKSVQASADYIWTMNNKRSLEGKCKISKMISQLGTLTADKLASKEEVNLFYNPPRMTSIWFLSTVSPLKQK